MTGGDVSLPYDLPFSVYPTRETIDRRHIMAHFISHGPCDGTAHNFPRWNLDRAAWR